MPSPEPVPKEVRSPVVKGQMVDRKYRVDDVLGAGGMGIVVSATHIALDEPVALKFMTVAQGRGDSTSRMRFLREAKAARKLTSAHVARVFDVGQLPTGEPYIVMELLRGDDLASYLRTRGRLTPADTVRFMLQVCDAIKEAHAIGIVHRDLKPQNLFLTTRPGGGTIVKVLDFGIAKSLEASDTDPSLTTSQNVVGSPVYMSPEQLRASKHVDERTDIWSLGVIMFELLAGRVPFLADSVMELGMRIMTVPAPSLVELRKEVPEALADVVQKCLEKEPENRFATIDALASALRPFVDISERSLPFADTLVEGSDRIPSGDRFSTGGEFAGTKGDAVRPSRAVWTWAAIAVAATAAALVTVVWPKPRATAVPSEPSHVAPTASSFAVHLHVTPPEAQIRFDTDAPRSSPFVTTLPTDGKAHRIVVEAEGYEPMELAFRDAPPPEEVALRKLPAPLSASEPPPAPPRKQPPRLQAPAVPPPPPSAAPTGAAPIKTTNDAPIIR